MLKLNHTPCGGGRNKPYKRSEKMANSKVDIEVSGMT